MDTVSVLFVLILCLHQSLAESQELESCKHEENPELCSSAVKALELDKVKKGPLPTTKATAALENAGYAVQGLLSATLRRSVASPGGLSHRQRAVIRDCIVLLQDASALIRDSHASLHSLRNVEDVHTWVSAALTYYTTCMDGLDNVDSRFLRLAKRAERSLSNTLSLIIGLRSSEEVSFLYDTLPWVSKAIGNFSISPNVTVAQDGTGQFTNISAALAAAPSRSSGRYVIYVKEGTYFESFEVAKQNLTLIGDGIGKTIITGNKSVQDPNITTFTSATVVIKADNFIAQDITFQNTAGAKSHQAVAVRVTADKASFFRCSFEGYQDTLYAHSFRQFYTQCDIYGTVDYIFGNAAAVFQNCNLYARLPMAKQKNTYTAQGRTDPNQNTGFSFQNCNILGTNELMANITQFPTYLGRPWKEYSVTIFLKSFESTVLHPAGWLPWDGEFALNTLFYGEYFCYGPGSPSSKRVNWSTQIYDSDFASKYTAASLLNGNDWIPNTNLPFTLAL